LAAVLKGLGLQLGISDSHILTFIRVIYDPYTKWCIFLMTDG